MVEDLWVDKVKLFKLAPVAPPVVLLVAAELSCKRALTVTSLVIVQICL